MIIHEIDHSLWLANLKDLDQIPRHAFVVRNYTSLTRIARWADDFLTNPHGQLGREGSVCPYTKPSMERDLFWLTVRGGANHTVQEVESTIMLYKDWFLKLEPTAGPAAQYKTILILFPDVKDEEAPSVIDGLQDRLKSQFVAQGLMIGQFHANCAQPGLWNDEFRPLQTPVPLLAIRNMVPSDFPFLAHRKDYMIAYLGLFQDKIPSRIRSEVFAAALAHGLLTESPLMEVEHA